MNHILIKNEEMHHKKQLSYKHLRNFSKLGLIINLRAIFFLLQCFFNQKLKFMEIFFNDWNWKFWAIWVGVSLIRFCWCLWNKDIILIFVSLWLLSIHLDNNFFVFEDWECQVSLELICTSSWLVLWQK